MPKMTKTQKLVAALEEYMGCTEVRSNSRKYRIFQSPNGKRFYLVGKAAGLRVNVKPQPTGSVSCAIDPDKLIEAWEKKFVVYGGGE